MVKKEESRVFIGKNTFSQKGDYYRISMSACPTEDTSNPPPLLVLLLCVLLCCCVVKLCLCGEDVRNHSYHTRHNFHGPRHSSRMPSRVKKVPTEVSVQLFAHATV